MSAGRAQAALAAILIVAAFAVYWPALHSGFVFDDHDLVERSALLSGPLWRIWFTSAAPDYWPLTYTTFWLERRLWGVDPAGFHLVNVALHAATTLLLWRALRALRVPGAWLGALLFAVHPVCVESVAWISERKNTLSAALLAGAVLAWIRFERGLRRRDHAAALSLFVLALLAKASAVMIPFVLLGITLHVHGRITRRDLARVAPFFAAAAALGALTAWFQWIRFMGVLPVAPRSLTARLGGAGWALATYLQKAFVPSRLAFAYPEWPVPPSSALFYVPLAIALAAAAALASSRRAPVRATRTALAFHAGVALPVLGLLDMAWFRIGPVADHLQYLPLMGVVALQGAALAWLAGRARAVAAICACAWIGWTGWTAYDRVGAFRDDLTLWARAAEDAPESLTAAWKYSDELASRGRVDEAVAVLQGAADGAGDEARRLRLRSVALLYSGEWEQAVAESERAGRLGRDPAYEGAFLDRLGTALVLGGHPAALEVFQALVARDPSDATRRLWLAEALARAGRPAEAIALLAESCRRVPGDDRSRMALATQLLRVGRIDEAREHVALALHRRSADVDSGVLRQLLGGAP
jgi:tetratricopeptide (TPR) repeat protein